MTAGDTDIRELDEATVERIAAGEVVERPASAVKELVENSLDAGASRIDVTVAAGGTERVEVADDGHGMTETDVRRAVERHTTSKIRDVTDLEAGVSTLGFRGEALATIGAVSRLTVTTKPPDAAQGTRLRMEGGEVTAVEPVGRPAGTTVEVTDLFYNTPARRKFLKTESTEFGHVNRVVTRYALANPDVAVSLTHDGRETFATTGGGDRLGAVLSVWGREVAESMHRVDAVPDSGAVERVHGYVSDPETTRSTREYLATYVNDRYVTEAALREAVLDAYGSQLAPDRFPFAVLFVAVPPDAVDVNVHPRKTAVRFDDEEAVRGAVAGAVEDALLDAGLVRSGAPRGRSAPDEAAVDPETGATDADAGGAATTDRGPSSGDHCERDAAGESTASAPEAEADAAGDRGPGAEAGPRDAATGRESGPRSASGDSERGRRDTPASGRGGPTSRGGCRDHDGDRGDAGGETIAGTDDGNSGRFEAATRNATLPGLDDPEGDDGFDRLPDMRVLGQVGGTYVVAATDDGLVVVDQHAADERVHYERLAGTLADAGATSQALVEPVDLELTAAEAAVFEDALADLEALGFEARLEDQTAVVTGVPAVLSDALDPALLRDVLAEFLAGTGDAEAVESAADALLADMACYPAITGGTSLTEGSVVGLLEALDDCENPFACPHGRPVLVEVSERELAERFERDYPGHRTRRPEDGRGD